MEKNITPNNQMQKPSFWKTFVYVFCVLVIFNAIFGKKKETSNSANVEKRKFSSRKRQEAPAENKNVTVRTFGRKKKDGENA